MTPQLTTVASLRIGFCAFGVLALLAFAAAFFVLISDDFVIRGQVVPATDPKVARWQICLSLAGLGFGTLAWWCYRRYRRIRNEQE